MQSEEEAQSNEQDNSDDEHDEFEEIADGDRAKEIEDSVEMISKNSHPTHNNQDMEINDEIPYD